MSQSLSEKLRKSLFEHLKNAIDWDDLGLQQSQFAAGSNTRNRPFRRLSLVFHRQDTEEATSVPIRLKIPFDSDNEDEFVRTAIALEGLLEVGTNEGKWVSPDASEKLAALLDLTDRSVQEIERQIRALVGDQESWDPVAGAVELLVVSLGLGGRLPQQTDTDSILDQLFQSPDGQKTFLSDELNRVYEDLQTSHETLVTFVRAHCSGSKGGVVGRFINPRPLLSTIEDLEKRNWTLDRVPARLSTDFYNNIGDIYQRISETLKGAIGQEQSLWKQWIERVNAAFGEGSSFNEIEETSNTLQQLILAEGFPVNSVTLLRPATEGCRTVLWDAVIKNTNDLISAKDFDAIIGCGNSDKVAPHKVDKLITTLTRVFSETDRELKMREGQAAKVGGREAEEAISKIETALGSIVSDLKNLRETANAN